MAIKIEYLNKKFDKKTSNLVIFSNDRFIIKDYKKVIPESEFNYIRDLLKTNDLKKNILTFEINSKKKIILISIKNDLKNSDIENLGAEFHSRINNGKNKDYYIFSDSVVGKYENFLGHFLHGVKLKSYEFKKYKSKKETRLISLKIFGIKNQPSAIIKLKFKALEEGTFYTRDLVSEPGNVLHPDEYAKRLNLLKKHVVPKKLKSELLKPTKIYSKEVLKLTNKKLINSAAHITGGGLIENLIRSVPKNLSLNLDLGKIRIGKIFKWLKSKNISDHEMMSTFNCGVGFCVIASKKNIYQIKKAFPKKFKPYEIGFISKSRNKINLSNHFKW